MIAPHELRLRLRKVEGEAVGLRETRQVEEERSDEQGRDEPNPEGRGVTRIMLLQRHDLRYAHVTGQHEHRDEAEREPDLVAHHLCRPP